MTTLRYQHEGEEWILTAQRRATSGVTARPADAKDVELALAALPYSERAEIWCAIHPQGHVAELRSAEQRSQLLYSAGQMLHDQLLSWRGSDEWDPQCEMAMQRWNEITRSASTTRVAEAAAGISDPPLTRLGLAQILRQVISEQSPSIDKPHGPSVFAIQLIARALEECR